VVLSAGTIGSPMILQRSGVGDAAFLQRLGIALLVDRPQVGLNYQDHVNVMLRADDPGRLSYGLSWRALAGLAGAPFEWLLRGKGLLATNFAYAGAFIRSASDLRRPDLQLIFWPVHRPPGKFIAAGHSFGVMAHVLRPESRGEVAISNVDPRSAPRLRTGALTDHRDVAQLVKGLRLARQVFAAPALARHVGAELEPGDAAASDTALEAYVRANVMMGLHCVGTCRMGSDTDAVVSPDLRVRGVEGLSVADCAIMPSIIGGNTAAPAMMIGEKASDLVLARAAI
jgi:choline dehydrogenase-like flavoprotein